MGQKKYKVGDTFKPKRSRVEYTVVATFRGELYRKKRLHIVLERDR